MYVSIDSGYLVYTLRFNPVLLNFVGWISPALIINSFFVVGSSFPLIYIHYFVFVFAFVCVRVCVFPSFFILPDGPSYVFMAAV